VNRQRADPIASRVVLLGLVILVAGCRSSPVLNSQYISPRVTGRVLDAVNSQPIRNVSIHRLAPGQNLTGNPPAAGGESLERTRALRTNAEGRFDLDSERDLMLFRRADWYSVTLAFTHTGYERYITNFTLTNAVIEPSGEPVIDAGNILLQPLSKKLTIN
jgi:hypothetical protein